MAIDEKPGQHSGFSEKFKKHKIVYTMIVVVVALVLYVIVRHLQGANSGASNTSSNGSTGTTGTAGGSIPSNGAATADDSSTIDGLLSALQGYQGLTSNVNTQGTSTNTAGSTTVADSANTGSNTTNTTSTGSSNTSTLPAGYGWFDTGGDTYTATSIANRYNLTLTQLQSYNPGMTIGAGSQIIGKDTPVQVRGNAAPVNQSAYQTVNQSFKP